jgi:hypothetical protein
MKRTIAAAAGLSLCLSGAQAQAQMERPCITDREMHGLVAYFLPAVLDELASNCNAHLPEGSYLRAGLPRLRTSLAEGKEAAWPAARAAFFKMSDAKDAKSMASLSDRALRPLVDELLAQKMSIKVNPPMCGEIDGIAEALAPLSPGETVHLIATIFNTVSRKDKKMRSCPRVEG